MTARDKCPAHYCFSDLQPWDVIDAWGLDYYLGNVLKYICRAGRKEPERLVDLNKALHYLQKEVELAERELERSSRFSSMENAWPQIHCSCGEEMEPIACSFEESEDEMVLYFCDRCEKSAVVRLWDKEEHTTQAEGKRPSFVGLAND